MRRRLVLVLRILPLLVLSGAGARQKPRSASLSDDSNVQVRLSANSAVYHQREVIPVTLSFTSKLPRRYSLNEATYDRGGRMGFELFVAEPSSTTSDPLRVYFASLAGILGGGLTNFTFLSKTPYVIHLNLNEWIR